MAALSLIQLKCIRLLYSTSVLIKLSSSLFNPFVGRTNPSLVATRSILLPLITDTSYLLIGCPVIPVVISLTISADDDEGLQNYTNENL